MTLRNLARISLATLAIAVAPAALAQAPPPYGILGVPFGGTGGHDAPTARAGIGAAANSGATYPALVYGSCVWDGASSHDVGSCINAAFSAAATAGGGIVQIPCGGKFFFNTAIVNHNSNVTLRACAIVAPNTNGTIPGIGGTVLEWNGGTVPVAVDFEPIDGNHMMSGSGIEGLWFDFSTGAKPTTGVRLASVSYANWDFGVANYGTVGIDRSTLAGTTTNSDSQHNTGRMVTYAANAASGSVGILTRKDTGSTTDWSFNDFTEFFAFSGANGTPMMFVNGDGEIMHSCYSFGKNPVVIANSSDALPAGLINGEATQTPMYRDFIMFHNDCSIVVHGLMSGATFTPNTVAGTEGPTTVPVTSATTASATNSLNLVSTSGLAAGEVLNFTGGYSSGVAPNSLIELLAGSTTVNLAQNVASAVSSGISGTASWGAVPGSAANGAYTLTYNGATYDLTAPSGGHSDTGVSPSGGLLSFTDLTIPWTTGAPVTGDSWTITLPTSTTQNIKIYQTDSVGGNNNPDPQYEPNISKSAGCFGGQRTMPCASFAPGQGGGIGAYASTNTVSGDSFIINSFNSVTGGTRSVVVGGSGHSVSGVDDVGIGGHNNTLTGTALYGAFVAGHDNFQTNSSLALNSIGGSDGNRKGVNFQGAGTVNSKGDDQSAYATMGGSVSTSGGTVRLTATGNSPSNNDCFNIGDGSTYFITSVTLGAADHVTASNYYTARWSPAAPYVLARGTGAASTTLNGSGTATIAPTGSATGGTGSTASATLKADTTNGCLSISFTKPTGDANQWIAASRVDSLETK